MPESTIRVSEIALPSDQAVVLGPREVFRVAVEKMSQGRLGTACVVDTDGRLIGVLTDGDIRRMLLRDHKPIAALFTEDIGDHMTPNPKTISPDTDLVEALSFLEQADVYDLPVVDGSGVLVGVLHAHTALKHLLAR